MTEEQWQLLLGVLDGQVYDPMPVGFIIDSPWLPGWAGVSILDYYTSESLWLQCNLQANQRFPQVMFLPGFWAEYGMCTEPSAFGAKCIWPEHEFPFAEPVVTTCEGAAAISRPDPRKDGLAPFVLKRLRHGQSAIEQAGHRIRFAVARGPMNIGAFLLGTTEFLTGLKTNPDEMHAFLKTISAYIVDWLQLQARTFPTIEGILILDDLVGFCGPADFANFCQPCLQTVFNAIDAKVRFFHNDARGAVCAPHLAGIGVNLFNFSFEHDLGQMKEWTGNEVTLLGNIPPRDVMAAGTPAMVEQSVRAAIHSLPDKSRVILSCGGGMPPQVSTQNIEAFLRAAGYTW